MCTVRWEETINEAEEVGRAESSRQQGTLKHSSRGRPCGDCIQEWLSVACGPEGRKLDWSKEGSIDEKEKKWSDANDFLGGGFTRA